jgi:hypothetical protein
MNSTQNNMNPTMDQPCLPGRFVLGQIVRWTARLCSLPLIYFLGCGLVGTFRNGGSVPARDILDFIFFPAGVTLGLILAWRWEALGAAMILVGIAEMDQAVNAWLRPKPVRSCRGAQRQ